MTDDDEPTEPMNLRERLISQAHTVDASPEMIGMSEVVLNKLERLCGPGDDRQLEVLIWTVLRRCNRMKDRVDEALELVILCCDAARLS